MGFRQQEIHAKAITGDEEAFLALMQLHKESLLRTALAFLRNEDDAIEALQEVTYRAYKNIKTVKEPSYLKTWLIRIMMNYCQDQLKLRKRFATNDSAVESMSTEDISHLEMNEALATLSDGEQRLIYLKYFQESRIKDIAQSENIPEGTVKSRIFYLLKELKEKLKAFETVHIYP